jgi:integrase
MPEKLTRRFVEAVQAPATGSAPIWDDDRKAKGFGLRVYASGAKSFFINYRVDGRERRFTIGDFPTWSVEAAREEARDLRKRIDKGHDPAGEKRERREAPTIQDLIDRYVAEHLLLKRVKSRGHEHLQKIAGYRDTDEKQMLAEIGNRLGKHTKVADVHGGDIRDMHRTISEARGPVRANRILAVCSKAFSLSLVPMTGENRPWRDAVMGNPCKGVPRNREEALERFFSQAELAAISDALAEYGAQARGPGLASAPAAADCIRLILLTGCRPQEGMLARWEEFDKEPGYWIKPSAHVKSNRAHKLPLSPPALELIDRLRKKRKAGATWLFAGQVRGQPLRQLRSIWHWVRNRAGLGADARIYDLRHTFASVGAGGGLSLPIIGKLLGHTQARTTQRYAHLADDPLREASAKIGAVIAGAGKAGVEVHLLHKKRAR